MQKEIYKMSEKEFATLKKVELEILDEFVRICEKHNLKYVLAFGTCLGAVRHNGFIPWDDDIDVHLSRSDYNKFIQIQKKELDNSRFYFQCFEEDNIAIPFAKLKRKDSQYKAINDYLDDEEQGIWIDIFPCDNLPDNKILSKFHFIRTFTNHLQLLDKYNQTPVLNTIPKKILFTFIGLKNKLISLKRLRNRINKLNNKYNDKKTKYITTYTCSRGNVFDQDIWSSNLFSKRILHKFENKQYYIPGNYDEYLKSCYGDYMQLPPEESRHPVHNLETLKFPKDYTK